MEKIDPTHPIVTVDGGCKIRQNQSNLFIRRFKTVGEILAMPRKLDASLAFVLIICCLLISVGGSASFAAEVGGDIVFEDTKRLPPVLFSHDKHKEAGTKCTDCHDELFQKKKGSTDADKALTMKALKKGKYCGSCHDGEKAFTASRNCKKCHHK